MKKIIIPILGVVLLATGFLLGRVTAPKPQTEPADDTVNISAPVTTEPEPVESEPAEPTVVEPIDSEGEQSEPEAKLIYLTRIYADVIQTEGWIVVQGIDNNSAGYRSDSQFIVDCSEETVITLDGSPVTVDDIAVGDRVSIDFTGDMAESDPAVLGEVLFIHIFRE